MSILYSINYPIENFEGANEMYIQGCNYKICYKEHEIKIFNYGGLFFNTYYNSFSIEKWRKYTRLDSLSLDVVVKGKCRISVYNRFLTAGDYIHKIVFTKEVDFEDFQTLEIDLTDCLDCSGILTLDVSALSEVAYFKSADYKTKTPMDPVKIAIGICTFKRESYVNKFVENFVKYNVKNHLEVFIADNGQTLEKYSDENVHLFPNKNYGGAGGFGRCMYEVKKANKTRKDKLTHMVLMDDDIFVDLTIFDKMHSFLSLLKPEYHNYFLAGAMCSLDYPHLQYERYASYCGGYFRQFSPNFDLRRGDLIIVNEREEKLDTCTAGWWCSCFSVDMIVENNYPFPCFFRGDDMEFTIRNGGNIITLNGINVWHEPFYKKYSIVSENYYLMRNELVINALYKPQLTWKQSTAIMRERFRKAILTYDYKGAEMIVRAIRDFGKGTEFFATTDPEALNKELSALNYKQIHLSEAVNEYFYDDIHYMLYHENDRSKFRRRIRLLTLNGYLLPKCLYRDFSFSKMGFGALSINYYKTKRVFCLDPFTNKGYFQEVSKSKALKLVMEFNKVCRQTGRRYEKIKNEYQCNFYKLQTEEFWKKYLEL